MGTSDLTRVVYLKETKELEFRTGCYNAAYGSRVDASLEYSVNDLRFVAYNEIKFFT